MDDEAKERWQRAMGLRCHAYEVIGERSLQEVIDEAQETGDYSGMYERLRFLDAYYQASEESVSWCEKRLKNVKKGAAKDRASIYLDFAIAQGIAPPGRDRTRATTRDRQIRILMQYELELCRLAPDQWTEVLQGTAQLPDEVVYKAARATYVAINNAEPKSDSTLRRFIQPVVEALDLAHPIPKDASSEKQNPVFPGSD